MTHWADDVDWSKHDKIREGCFVSQEEWDKMSPEERKHFAKYILDPLPRRTFPKLICKDLVSVDSEGNIKKIEI